MALVSRLTSTGNHLITGEYDEYTLQNNIYATQFNGSSQYLSATNAAGWLPSSLGDWTIESWIYLTGYSASYSGGYVGIIASSSVTNNNNASWQFGLSGTASSWTNFFLTFWTSGSASSINFNTNFNLSTWYHVAATKQGSTISLYVNGTLITSGSPTTNNGTTVLRIGDLDTSGFRYFFPGYISNFRIVKSTSVYTSNFTPSLTPLTNITNTTILTCQNSTIIDNSTNGFTISNPNSATTSKITSGASFIQLKQKQYSNGDLDIIGEFDEVIYNQDQSRMYSVLFNGTSQYINTGVNSITSTVFTFECHFYLTDWLKSTGAGGYLGLLFSGNVTSSAWLRLSGTASSVTDLYHSWVGSSGPPDMGWSINCVLNTWYHLAISRNGSTWTAWLNGVKLTSILATNPGSTYSAGNMTIGVNTNNPAYAGYFPGYISNFKMVTGSNTYDPASTSITVPVDPYRNQGITYYLYQCAASSVSGGVNGPTASTFVPFTSKSMKQFSDGRLAVTGEFDEYTFFNYYSAQFDGSTNYLLTGSSTTGITSQNFTVECWFNLSSLTWQMGNGQYAGTIINAAGSGALNNFSDGGIWIYIGGGTSNVPTYISLTSSGATNVGPTVSATGLTINLNTWYHLAISRSGTNFAIWLNGVKLTITTSNTSNNYQPGTISIGVLTHSNGYRSYLSGYMSNLRIVRGSTVYDPTGGNITVPTSPLTDIVNTYLLTCQNPTIIDNSTNKFTITNNGSVTTSKLTSGPFK